MTGRQGAWLGYEHRGLEGWIYPLEVVDDLRLAFSLEGYPLDIPASDISASIEVRPEATIVTHAHAAFTVRQILFVPVDEPALVVLLDISTTLPLTVTGSFKPRLRLMWPAGLMTPNVEWDEDNEAYVLGEESKRFAGVVGIPGGRDLSVMPYQEEPRDQPLRFQVDTRGRAATELIPIVVAGSMEGSKAALAAYHRVIENARGEFEKVVEFWRAFDQRTLSLETPDAGLDRAFAWAKVGAAKGMVTNRLLGTGFVAGYRASGDSERPGFAWFFGRDTLWTSFAVASYGDLESVEAGLDFLRKYQRQDGKIPHEVSQSAPFLPWFDKYPYPWASADATPLYVIAHTDVWRVTGDREYLATSWPSILKAYEFTRGTDADNNALVDNTNVGHGWVEGGALYPPHEEIYQQGVWIEAQRGLAELARVMGDETLAREADEGAARAVAAVEQRYWLERGGFYAFGTKLPTQQPPEAEAGPARDRRQARLAELAPAMLIDEDTVLPAVPLWWGQLRAERAALQIDRLGSGHLATDWGTRILSSQSRLYDPLSYHYGSVWPLFTGWASMAAYRYGRPHVGFQGIAATAHLTDQGALGYITELLSGDYNAPFGRSSHHQIWSEAMLITPLVRGLLGIELREGGQLLRIAPQLPANWNRVRARRLRAAGALWQLDIETGPGRLVVSLKPESTGTSSPPAPTERASAGGGGLRVQVAPALPVDARVRRVLVGGRTVPFRVDHVGDIQRPEITTAVPAAGIDVEFIADPGTEVWTEYPAPAVGDENRNLKILRARASARSLELRLEGREGQPYTLFVRTPATLVAAGGATVRPVTPDVYEVRLSFTGERGTWIRRDLALHLRRR